MSVASIYRPPNVPVDTRGDFNGHHYLWGSIDNNPPVLTLVDAVDNFHYLIFRNEGQPTRLTRPSANISAIHVTILSTDLLDISTWTVMGDTYGSDHFPILININSITTNIDSHSTYKWRIYPHPDWNRFADKVNPSLIWKRAKSISKEYLIKTLTLCPRKKQKSYLRNLLQTGLHYQSQVQNHTITIFIRSNNRCRV
nr:unnamed protein product [Callosobruchus analis]